MTIFGTLEVFNRQNILTEELINQRKHLSGDLFMTLQISVIINFRHFLGHLRVKSAYHCSYQGMKHLFELNFILQAIIYECMQKCRHKL